MSSTSLTITILALAATLALSAQAQEPAPLAPVEPATKPLVADGRRTLGRFVVNLGRNALGLFSRDNLEPLPLGAALTGAAVPADASLKRYFGATRRAKWLGDAADVEGRAEVLAPVMVAAFAAGRIARNQSFRDMTYDMAQALLIDGACSTGLKAATRRLRPDASNYRSFPSGHTSNAFAMATVAAHYYGLKVAVPAYFFAGLVGVGRMEKNAHYLSDIVAGAVEGTIVGRTVVRVGSTPLTRGASVSMLPMRDMHGTGSGLALRVEF
jgi:membrane-associated phospholipid phosphatase